MRNFESVTSVEFFVPPCQMRPQWQWIFTICSLSTCLNRKYPSFVLGPVYHMSFACVNVAGNSQYSVSLVTVS